MRRFVFVLPFLSLLGLVAACPAPVPSGKCSKDTDCAFGYACDPKTLDCVLRGATESQKELSSETSSEPAPEPRPEPAPEPRPEPAPEPRPEPPPEDAAAEPPQEATPEFCPPGTVPQAEDCDDKDNDCDGKTDENLTRPCPTFPSGCALGPDGKPVCQGVCAAGFQVCKGGLWETFCQGQTFPATEICDGKDNDCDGKVDETIFRPCYSTPGQGCTLQGPSFQCVGRCSSGTQTCTNGTWGGCIGEVTPAATEACNGTDADCDGKTDESCSCNAGDSRPCGQAVGRCRAGIQVCQGGIFGPCTGATQPTTEICNNQDDDCDGKTDENFPEQGQPCTVASAKGLCAQSIRSCQGGVLECFQTVNPAPETCDGRDENCNGMIDDGLTRPCFTGVQGCVIDPTTQQSQCTPPCLVGKQTCNRGVWEACIGEVLPQAEVCNRRDDDCDGKIDESIACQCTAGQTRACGSNIGDCKQGSQTCLPSGDWGACQGQTTSTSEICDSKDNDCDGKTDEGLQRSCVSCAQPGTQSCSQGVWQPCEILGKPEICNGQDDDCDGKVDESVQTQSCTCSTSAGRQQCLADVVPPQSVCVTGTCVILTSGLCVLGASACKSPIDPPTCFPPRNPSGAAPCTQDGDCAPCTTPSRPFLCKPEPGGQRSCQP